MDKIDLRFVAAVKATEKRTACITAAAVIDPTNPKRWGRVVISGKARRYAIAWLPGEGGEMIRHHGSAGGGGYDRATAAMGGAEFIAPNGQHGTLVNQGHDWRAQLERAGFLVIVAV